MLILEAMADGCSPLTGEVLPHDHLLLDERVMEAVLIALEVMRGQPAVASSPRRKPVEATGEAPAAFAEVPIPDDELFAAVEVFKGLSITPTAHRLSAFLCGERKFKEPELLHHPLAGKYHDLYQKAQLVPSVEAWIKQYNVIPPRDNLKEIHPFFAEPHFNKLSERAIEQLKEKVTAIPIVKVEGLSEDLIERRKTMPRSHEPWPEEELRLLRKATEFTNDLQFLSTCFGRSELALSAQAEKWLSPQDVDLGQ